MIPLWEFWVLGDKGMVDCMTSQSPWGLQCLCCSVDYCTPSRDVDLARVLVRLVGASGQQQDLFPRKQSPNFPVFSALCRN